MQLYKYEKPKVPQQEDEVEEFCVNLSKFGISLKEYKESLKTPKKRKNPGTLEATEEVRRSPRLGASPMITVSQSKDGTTARRNLFPEA